MFYMNLQKFIKINSEPNEVWKDIPSYEEFYMISSYGRVLAKPRLVNNGYKDVQKPTKLLKNNICEKRVSIQLAKDGKTKKFSVSQLVAELFIPKPHPDYLLKFKNGDTTNCHKDNLIWVPKIDRHAKFIIEQIEGEEWKDVLDFEGLYKISNKGRVMSLGRSIQATNRVITTQDKILTPTSDVGNYQYITLCNNTEQKRFFVHRLVAQAFIPNPDNFPHIDHIDTNKHNNCVENLRWVTPTMNMQNELTKQHLSGVRKNTRLNESWNCVPIVQLKGSELIKIYPSIAEADREGFGYSGIQKCLSGRQRTHKKFTWMYLSDYVKLSPQTSITEPTSAK